ncbi:MAG TPA: glycosyltransferase, partial [Anaerovoracaceae bacterium]|nr:glycosyltransferase [Anaerovoracaceae bacterium]
IYDCVDRHSAYKGMINPKVVDEMEKDLASSASYIFCTAAGLYDTLYQYNKNVTLIPNGADYELFSKAAKFVPVKRSKPWPVFGFVGMLQECIKYEWMEALAKAFPKGELVLVGGELPGVDLTQLKKYSNIKFAGLVPQEELPEIIGGFDVCLNLFRKGRLSKDVSPLKLYEYLATGKPVVSTAEPLQALDYADVVYIAENEEDFMLKCREALQEKDPSKSEKRMKYANEASWDNRVMQMEDILIGRGIFQ